MNILKSVAAVAVVSALALGASATAFAQDKGIIGIAMPEQTTLRWNSDGAELKSALEAKGYTVDLQYAGDDIPNQLAQIENMVTKGSKALIIAALDGTTLSAALESAGAAASRSWLMTA